MKKILTIVFIAFSFAANAQQDVNIVLQKAKTKLETVNDYQVSGRMKTNVAFLKVPVASITVYYKKPDKLRVKSEKGISFIPKGAVSINMNNIIGAGKFTVIDAGMDKLNGLLVRVARLLPDDDNSDVVLSTVYIDEANSLIMKARTTTKENGTFELEMTYGKYISYGLPDKVIFSFNTKDYKLPKGVTFDFDDGTQATPADKTKNRKGKAEITFSNYVINRGVSDAVFK